MYISCVYNLGSFYGSRFPYGISFLTFIDSLQISHHAFKFHPSPNPPHPSSARVTCPQNKTKFKRKKKPNKAKQIIQTKTNKTATKIKIQTNKGQESYLGTCNVDQLTLLSFHLILQVFIAMSPWSSSRFLASVTPWITASLRLLLGILLPCVVGSQQCWICKFIAFTHSSGS